MRYLQGAVDSQPALIDMTNGRYVLLLPGSTLLFDAKGEAKVVASDGSSTPLRWLAMEAGQRVVVEAQAPVGRR